MEAQRQVGAAGGRAERGIPAREAVPEAVATTGHPAVGSAFLLRQLPVLLGGAVLSANTELTNGRYQGSCLEGVLGNRELSKAHLPPPLLLTGSRCNCPSSSSHAVTLRMESTQNKGGRESEKQPGSLDHPSSTWLPPSGSFPRGNNPWWFGVSVIAAEP